MRESLCMCVYVCVSRKMREVCVRHIKTIAKFDCTSYPTRAHSDPVLRLWEGLTWKHHSSIAFFFPGTIISHFLDFFLSLFSIQGLNQVFVICHSGFHLLLVSIILCRNKSVINSVYVQQTDQILQWFSPSADVFSW